MAEVVDRHDGHVVDLDWGIEPLEDEHLQAGLRLADELGGDCLTVIVNGGVEVDLTLLLALRRRENDTAGDEVIVLTKGHKFSITGRRVSPSCCWFRTSDRTKERNDALAALA